MPWRDDHSPYFVFVSEVMLQQTQVSRVIQKFPQFIARFPDFHSLSRAHTAELLSIWQGMGYNRRALYLKQASKIIGKKYHGVLPKDQRLLDELPGIGPATASAIVVYTYNVPVVFIETNIRRIFIHHFFSDKKNINDADIIPHIQKTVDKKNPREWYWALMDYGAYLGKGRENPNKKSNRYVKQSQFEGSTRQMRGELLKIFLQRRYTKAELERKYNGDERLATSLDELEREGFVRVRKGIYCINNT